MRQLRLQWIPYVNIFHTNQYSELIQAGPIENLHKSFISLGQVNLAMEMKDQGVIGIDLSGNPVVGEW